jgi:hypothetical protein
LERLLLKIKRIDELVMNLQRNFAISGFSTTKLRDFCENLNENLVGFRVE